MGYLLNVSEVLDFAVFIEQNGYRFYVEAMKKLDDSRIMQLFQYLADEEFKHEKLFAMIKEQFGNFTPPESYDGEYAAYMKEFCKAHSLANREVLATKLEKLRSLPESLDMALGFEKDSIVFFTELKDLVSGDRARTVERVIHEEMDHIRRIMEFKGQLGPR